MRAAAKDGTVHALVFRVDGGLCALPLAQVRETLRPLPCQALGALPSFLDGVAQIRGVATPVVNAARLLGRTPRAPGRYVLLRVAPSPVAVAVDEVVGVRELPAHALEALPSLLAPGGGGAVEALARLDAGLLVVLEAGRLVPADAWAQLERGGAA